MINFTVLKSAAQAKGYYTPDYYVEGERPRAFFGGKLAEALGLGEFDEAQFRRLCDGRHPVTNERLTPGRKSERRAGYDVTVDGPKDLGVLMALGLDQRILPEVLERAGREVMEEIEKDAHARVRVGDRDEDRRTGNIAYAGIVHLTARPVGGKVDVQPHVHFICFNATLDTEEGRMKALQLQPFAGNGAREARPYYTALLNARLASHMTRLGYEVEANGDTFRVVGVPERVVSEFSQRTHKIEAVARELGRRKQEALGDPHAALSPEAKGRLGARTRERKLQPMTWEGLTEHWRSRVSGGEWGAVLHTAAKAIRGPAPPPDRSREALDFALRHLSERKSAFTERELLTHALRRGLGAVTPERLRGEMAAHPDVIRRGGGPDALLTTRQALEDEARVAAFALAGMGACRPAGPPAEGRAALLAGLSATQAAAVEAVWGSRGRVLPLIRGVAGTGKTTLMRAALAGLSCPWVVLAPTAAASRGVLRAEGFGERADTLARFLRDQGMQSSVRGGVIWVDEAGLVGTRDLRRLVDVAEGLGARLVFSGDRAQHKSVPAGDALGLLQRAGVEGVTVSEIRRQSGVYRDAVAALARGDAAQALATLEGLGWVRELDGPAGLHEAVARDYVAAVKAGRGVLAVSPTHAQGDAITERVRGLLKAEGLLGADERELPRLEPLHWTEAERAANPREGAGLVARFVRPGAGFRAGQEAPLASVPDDTPPALFQVCRRGTIRLAPGDRVRATAGVTSLEGARVDNGTALTVEGFTGEGAVLLRTASGLRRTLAPGEGLHLRHGYCSTSHSAQGMTEDVVLVAMGRESFPALSAEAAYVSCSRGRHSCTVYTDDPRGMAALWGRGDDRALAHDALGTEPGAWRPWKSGRGLRARMRRLLPGLPGPWRGAGIEAGLGRDGETRGRAGHAR